MELQTDDIYGQIGEDQPPDLNNLLSRLQNEVPNSQWYQFGLALGVPKEILDQIEEHAGDNCLTELLDYWLNNHKGQPSWREVDEAQRRIDCDRQQYSE